MAGAYKPCGFESRHSSNRMSPNWTRHLTCNQAFPTHSSCDLCGAWHRQIVVEKKVGCAMTQTNMATTQEQDLRLRLMNTLLTTPHRKLDEIHPVHAEMVKQDPRFYVRLAAWYSDRGDVRDHKEMFVVTLVLSDFPGHRDVGLALLRQLPPYEVGRVLDFVHGRKTTRK